MRNPKVSIIIAAYNAGPTIEKALCSVEKQSFQDWECLIIDGMSQDDTIQKVKYFADKDNRFQYFQNRIKVCLMLLIKDGRKHKVNGFII